MRIGLDCLLAARDVAPPPPHTVRGWVGGGGAGIPLPGLLPPQSVSQSRSEARLRDKTHITYAIMCYSHLPTKEKYRRIRNPHTYEGEFVTLRFGLGWGGWG